MIRFAVLAADLRLGQLTQPRGEIDVGVRIIGAPAEAALLAAHAAIHQPAEMPAAVEVGDVGKLRRRADLAAPSAAEAALGLYEASEEQRTKNEEQKAASHFVVLFFYS